MHQGSTWLKLVVVFLSLFFLSRVVSARPISFPLLTGKRKHGGRRQQRRRHSQRKLVGVSPELSYSLLFPNPRARGERGGRGGSILVTPGMGNRGWLWQPLQPWLWRPGARGELCLGRERGCRELGQVEEGVEVLTLKGIGPR